MSPVTNMSSRRSRCRCRQRAHAPQLVPAEDTDVPAADSTLSISPVAQDAMFGISAATTAAAWIRGVAWNACAPIMTPM